MLGERLGPLSLKPGVLGQVDGGPGGLRGYRAASGLRPRQFSCRLKWAGTVCGPDPQIPRWRDDGKGHQHREHSESQRSPWTTRGEGWSLAGDFI